MNKDIKCIVGLGNPGPRFVKTRHNIGFMILDALCDRYHGSWQRKDLMDVCDIRSGDQRIILVKPQTFMNESGKIMPALAKQGIKAENIVVVHDELEKPFGKVNIKQGGSARGHNGLRSIIAHIGADFARLRFGISRPESKDMVSDYVLSRFAETDTEIELGIEQAIELLEELLSA